MDDVRLFHQYLNKFVNLTDDEFRNIIKPLLKIRKFNKREYLIKPGEIENYLNFITRGLVRKFYKKDREEFNVQISTEGHLIHVQESFHSRHPSEFYVEAIEPSQLISVTYNDLENIYAHSAKMERLGRLVITHTTILRDRLQMHLIKYSPRERFLNFVTKNPELLQRVPQKYLASFLNIQPETFSRFKHLLKERKVS
jgi:CRP-like cAMP-binding protein